MKSHFLDINTHPITQTLDTLCLTETKVMEYENYPINNLNHVISGNSLHGCAIYSSQKPNHWFTFNGHIETVGIILKGILIVVIYILPNRPWYIIKNLLVNLLRDCEQIKKIQLNREVCNVWEKEGKKREVYN